VDARPIPAIRWEGGPEGRLLLLDQTKLPSKLEVLEIRDVESLARAIRELAVRGAPAIGVAAAYGGVLALRESPPSPRERLEEALDLLAASRPTAVNLFHALSRLRRRAAALPGEDPATLAAALLDEARTLHREDEDLCASLGRHGATLLEDGMTVLTHCNTGRLATAGVGTALACILTAHREGKRLLVYADETRPLLQGARLTLFELAEAGIEARLLVDGAGPGLLLAGEIQAVFVGADRIAANGDTANKVGTLPLALAASRAGVPFYVVAPSTTLDPSLPDGRSIPIEERDGDEVTSLLGDRVPPGTRARNPAFDVTPADLITALVTEHGICRSPDRDGIKALLDSGR